MRYGGRCIVAASRICVLPFAYGEPFAEFYTRIYGWRRLGDSNDPMVIWIPTLLVELFGITSSQSGIIGNYLGPTEYLVDTLSVTNGSLGSGYGTSPGGGLPAYAVLDIQGCQKIQFDFVVGEEYPAFGNALWAFAG